MLYKCRLVSLLFLLVTSQKKSIINIKIVSLFFPFCNNVLHAMQKNLPVSMCSYQLPVIIHGRALYLLRRLIKLLLLLLLLRVNMVHITPGLNGLCLFSTAMA